MGTNYYASKEPEPPCSKCGHQVGEEQIHIGKSSGGWVFQFNQHPFIRMEVALSWYQFIELNELDIYDEYGKEISLDDFRGIVGTRTHPRGLHRPSHNDRDRWIEGAGTWDMLKTYNEFC